ncbi:hypothetical protein ACQP1W_33080 [Spirillospora sp. CA-255316]
MLKLTGAGAFSWPCRDCGRRNRHGPPGEPGAQFVDRLRQVREPAGPEEVVVGAADEGLALSFQ